MSSAPDSVSFFRSVALRLALWNALLFGASAAVVLAGIYLLIARTIAEREREALELRAAEYAHAYETTGIAGLRSLLDLEGESPQVRSLYVRLVGRDALPIYSKVPSDWPIEETEQMVPDGWGGWRPQRVQTAHVPRGELRDIVRTDRMLNNGVLLQVARSTDSRAMLLVPLRRTMWIAGSIGVLVAVSATMIVSWWTIRPVRQVAATAHRIVTTGDLSARVPATRRRDEVGDLVDQFNTLLQRNSTLLHAMKEALDNVAHDVRTPLTRLRAGAEAALSAGGDTAAVREALADCVEETDRIRALLDALLDVSAAEAGVLSLKVQAVDLGEVLDGVVDLYGLVAEEKDIRVGFDKPAAPLIVQADPTRLRQVVSNLVDNAVKYTPAGGSVLLAAESVAAGGSTGARVAILVRDTGPGIPEAEQENIWRRLYRADTSRSQRGLGLGLSVVKAVVEAHGGTVAMRNRPEGGAEFRVELPAE